MKKEIKHQQYELEFNQKRKFVSSWIIFQKESFNKEYEKLREKCKIFLETGDLKKSGLERIDSFRRHSEFSEISYENLAKAIIYSKAMAYGSIKTQEYGDNSPYMMPFMKSAGINDIQKKSPGYFNKKYAVKTIQSISPRYLIGNIWIAGVHPKSGGAADKLISQFFGNNLSELYKAASENHLNIRIFWACNKLPQFIRFKEEIEKFLEDKNTSIIEFIHFDDIETISF